MKLEAGIKSRRNENENRTQRGHPLPYPRIEETQKIYQHPRIIIPRHSASNEVWRRRARPAVIRQPTGYTHVQFNSKRRPLLPASPLNRKILGPFSPTASKHRFRPNYRPTEIVANLFAAGLYRVGSVSPRDEPLISRGPGVGGGWGSSS